MNELAFILYKNLYTVRKAEEYIVEHYFEDEMKTPMHMSMGQEAVSVGVCHALKPKDQILTSYRSHAAFLAKTKDIDKFFAELCGKESGTAQGKAGSMHLAAPEKGYLCASGIVATCIPMAVGAAFANKWKRNGQISCVFFGDGACNEGAFWESLNVACLMKLPVLFVCEDNGLAVHTPTYMRQGYKSITNIVSEFECNVFQEDTTDVGTIYQLALNAIESIRTTNKPAFIYLKCYRYLEHVGICEDFDAGYRSRADFDEWYGRDCVILQRKKLVALGYTEADILCEERLIDRQIQNAVERAKNAPFPKLGELYKGVFYEGN